MNVKNAALLEMDIGLLYISRRRRATHAAHYQMRKFIISFSPSLPGRLPRRHVKFSERKRYDKFADMYYEQVSPNIESGRAWAQGGAKKRIQIASVDIFIVALAL